MYLKDISNSIDLKNALQEEEKTIELYEHKRTNHNMNGTSFTLAMNKSVNFLKST